MDKGVLKPLTKPFDAVVFDCDATLSACEGIDFLAELNQVGHQVKQLTDQAMSTTGLVEGLYQKRLEMVKPTLKDCEALVQEYQRLISPDLLTVLDIVRHTGKDILILSAGVNPAVKDFAQHCGIEVQQVHAVDLYFDSEGQYQNFDKDNVLTRNHGKKKVIASLSDKYTSICHIGDGINDAEGIDVVERFIGYGGVCYRPAVEAMADAYTTEPSMLALLPLLLTEQEVLALPPAYADAYQKGKALNHAAQ